MMTSILSWLTFAAAIFIVYKGFSLYLRTRSTFNNLMALASKEFHDASNSLLTADPNEIPDDVLNALKVMNRSAASGHGHRDMVRTLKEIHVRKTSGTTEHVGWESGDLKKSASTMRPELTELFDKAVVGWLNFLSTQNVWVGFQIALGLRRLEADSGKLENRIDTAGKSILPRMENGIC